MRKGPLESGQALILIVLAIFGLVGLTGLAIDGGMAYSNRRTAQNAADSAALAAALGHARGRAATSAALAAALTNGFTNDGTTNTVTVTIASLPIGACTNYSGGEDITVQIVAHARTFFAPIVGVRQLTNTVSATARSCDSYIGPIFPGNAIVALASHGIGFDGAGTPNWTVAGGGIFSNSSDSPSARCKGAAGLKAPALTAVGGVQLACNSAVPDTETGSLQWDYSDYSSMLPHIPDCTGRATKIGGFWTAQPDADGSKVSFSGNMNFGPGLYCVENSPGPFHGQISGTGVTFYLMPSNFSITLNGGGSFAATAPTSGGYAGVLMFSAPQLSGGVLQSTQSVDLRGNGTGDVRGSIILPSANVTMFGNSNSAGYNTQVIANRVDSGGNANITINYHASDGYQTTHPAWITLLR